MIAYHVAMAEPTTVAGLALAACTVLGGVVAYLFREWNGEREKWNVERLSLLAKIEAAQAARVADAQRQGPDELLRLVREEQRVLTATEAANVALTRAVSELQRGIEELPEEVVRSIRQQRRPET